MSLVHEKYFVPQMLYFSFINLYYAISVKDDEKYQFLYSILHLFRL